MKKVLLLIGVIGLFLVGCQDSNLDPVSPTAEKMSISKLPNETPVTLDNIDFSSMKLNKWRGLYNKIFRASQHSVIIKNKIWGTLGGTVKLISFSTNTSNGRPVKIKATLTFAPNALNGDEDIYMVVDPDDASLTFFPDISQFQGKVTLDATISGIDVSALSSANSPLNFVYIPDDPNADVQIISNNGVNLDKSTGSVSVHGAKLKHFSRYAWAR